MLRRWLKRILPAEITGFISRCHVHAIELTMAKCPVSWAGLVLSHLVRRFLRYVRGCGNTGVPSEKARAALRLGQWADMLATAGREMRRYRDGVLGPDSEYPPLARLERVHQHLIRQCLPIEFLDHAVRLAPRWAEAWYELARRLNEEGEYAKAVCACRRALTASSWQDPDRLPEDFAFTANGVYVKVQYLLGKMYLAEGDEIAAIRAFADALIEQPDSAIASVAYADLLVRRDASVASMEYWGAAMSARPYIVATPKSGRSLDDLERLVEQDLVAVGMPLWEAVGV